MVHDAVLHVIHGTIAQFFESVSLEGSVERYVMVVQNLREMGHVIFSHAIRVVFHHVCYGGRYTAMIKRSPVVGKNEDQSTARAGDTLPFQKRLHWVREVLEVMRRQHKVISAVGYRRERRAFRDDDCSRRPVRTESIRVVVRRPHCLA